MQPAIRIISEQPLRRTGLVDILVRSGFDAQGFASAKALLEERSAQDAQAIVFDLEMEEDTPCHQFERVCAVLPQTPQVAVGSPLQIAILHHHHEILAVASDEPPERIAQTIRQAIESGGGGAGARTATDDAVTAALRALTPRQQDVMRWLAIGADNLKIAVELGVSERSIKAHVSALLERCQAENRTELALIAFRAGLRPSVR